VKKICKRNEKKPKFGSKKKKTRGLKRPMNIVRPWGSFQRSTSQSTMKSTKSVNRISTDRTRPPKKKIELRR
jgi:hypothetical protein